MALLVLLQDQRWKIHEEATCLKAKVYSERLAFLLINSKKQAYNLYLKIPVGTCTPYTVDCLYLNKDALTQKRSC